MRLDVRAGTLAALRDASAAGRAEGDGRGGAPHDRGAPRLARPVQPPVSNDDARAPSRAASGTIERMDELILDIIDRLRGSGELSAADLNRIVQEHNRAYRDPVRHFAKKQLLPYYRRVKRDDPKRWESWQVDTATEDKLVAALQMKPRRTASGVATITVITKPWTCASNCLYCPNDIRMPKSYLHREPACQRAERACFDPYLQVAARLHALVEMGHPTDKVELIVLGGSWTDYPVGYRIWFARELFRALNEAGTAPAAARARDRRAAYARCGIACDDATLSHETAAAQARIDGGEETYNEAWRGAYARNAAWRAASAWQTCSWDALEAEQRANETAPHRVVGFVMETRPDAISEPALRDLRRLGATKVQIGIQSLRPAVLTANRRVMEPGTIQQAMELIRLFGFKEHTHFMANLLGSAPDDDIADYRTFVTDPRFLPDEVKIYPCALVDGTGLARAWREGRWAPYNEDDLVRVLVADTLATPPYTRISRMIRDISAQDIMAGNKKTNLRQMVDAEIERQGQAGAVREIRYREVGTHDMDDVDVRLEAVPYETTVTREVFLQWVTPTGRIAGFLRLSLPHPEAFDRYDLPTSPDEAMIREVHVYGRAAKLGGATHGAQHRGLGRALVERACEIAREAGYARINVISAVGTREYYRHLGFYDAGLYERKDL